MRTAFISGNLGQDPQVFAPQGSEYTCLTFSIGNGDMSRKNQSGGYDTITQWFTVKFWTKKPQDWLHKLTKGTSVVLETEIETETWEKDGQNHYKTVFKVRNGSWPYIQNRSIGEQQQVQQEAQQFEDDIPF